MDRCKSEIIDKDQMRFFKQCKTQLIDSLYNRYHYYYLMENQIIFFYLLWRVSPLVNPSRIHHRCLYIYMMKPHFTGDNSII